MQHSRRTFVKMSGSVAVYAEMAGPLFAAMRPPIDTLKIICGYPAGSPPDMVARQVGERMVGSYAKSVIVDNRTGAAGRIAVDALKTAPPDGSVMLLTPASVMTMYPHIYRQLSYNPLVDFAAVSVASDFSHAVAVGPMVPESVRTAREFLSWCRTNSQKATCGNPGAGSLPHFIAVLFEREGGVSLQHAPYRGTGPAVQDLLGGHIAAAVGPEGNFMPYTESGKLRVIAMTDGKRSRFLPLVPTFAEQGFNTIRVREWFGFFMPGSAPNDVVEEASAAVRHALSQKDVSVSFQKLGMETAYSSPAELTAKVKSEIEYWGPIIKPTGFTAES